MRGVVSTAAAGFARGVHRMRMQQHLNLGEQDIAGALRGVSLADMLPPAKRKPAGTVRSARFRPRPGRRSGPDGVSKRPPVLA